MTNKLQIVGITASLTLLMVLALALFVKSMGIILDSWFVANAIIIAIISGAIVFIGILTGAISLGVLTSKGKNIFN